MPSNYFLGSPTQVQDTFESALDTPLLDADYSRLSYDLGEKTALTGVLAGSFVTGVDKVSYEEARKEAELVGVPGLDFTQYTDGSVDRERLTYQIQRQKELREIQTQLDRGAGTTSSYLNGVGSWLGAIASDRLEIASMLIPVGRVAGTAVKGATMTERLAARGVMGFKEGAISAAAIEPLYAMGATDSGDDYDIYDSFTNVAFSGAAGSVLGSAGGFIADSFKARKLGGIPSALSPEDEIKILNTAAAQLETTGRLDVSDLMNSTYLKNTGHSFDDIIQNPELRNIINEPGGLIKLNRLTDDVIQGRVFTDDPEFAVKYQDLVNEVETLRVQVEKGFEPIEPEPTKYDRALTEPTNLALKKESQDYAKYKQLMVDASSTKDQRILKKLNREAEELNTRHDGKLKLEYDKSVNNVAVQRAEFEAQQTRLQSLEADVEGLTTDLNQRKLLKRLEMENDAKIKQDQARDFMLSSNNRMLEDLDRKANEITLEAKSIKDIETLDDISRQMDDILTSFKDEVKRYKERTGVELEIDEPEIDIQTVKTATREIAECMVKNGF